MIWEILVKFSGFFWRLIVSRKNSYSSAEGIQFQFVQFRKEFFYYVDSTSSNGLSYYGYDKLLHRWSIYHGGENFRKTCIFFIISAAWAEVWLPDFECFKILCRSMVSFDLSIPRACLRVSSVAWSADIALGIYSFIHSQLFLMLVIQ